MALVTTLPPLRAEEINAILAGLRTLQYLMDRDQLPPAIREILNDHGRGLGLDQINELCQRINCA
jgi:hypothetical protein